MEYYLNPNIIAKFQFSETSPWTYLTPTVNLTLSHVRNDQMGPSIYISLHKEIKDIQSGL